MHLSILYTILCDQTPALRGFEPRLIHRYANLILCSLTPGRYKHERAGTDDVPDHAFAASCRFLEKEFGRGGFAELNQLAECFESSPGWHLDQHLTRPYWLSAVGFALIEEMNQILLHGTRSKLVNKNGGIVRNKSNAVYTSRDTDDRKATTVAKVRFLVPVQLRTIKAALSTGIRVPFPDLSAEKAASARGQLLALHSIAMANQFGRGLIPQTYRESPSGRLCGYGQLSLQNAITEVRHIALAGNYDYDFANCHYCLIGHIARKYGICVPQIQAYVSNPKKYRENLAAELDITPKQAKTCLLAVLYGATESVRSQDSIPSIIGPEKARLLYRLLMFTQLCTEVLEVGQVMLAMADRRRDGAILNCRGKAIVGNQRQELAHLLQGLESELLHSVIHKYGTKILVLQHDGFTLSEFEEPKVIERLIFANHGIRMPVTCKFLSTQEPMQNPLRLAL